MSERAKTVVKIALLVVSVVAIVLLIIDAANSAESMRYYLQELARPEADEWDIEFFQTSLNIVVQRLAAEILSIIVLACFNLYIWLFHKIPTAAQRKELAEKRLELKKRKLQERQEKLQEELEKLEK